MENLGSPEGIDRGRMARLAKEGGIALSDAQLGQLERYAELLLRWSTKMNLTAIISPPDIEVKHFLDCLLVARRAEVRGAVVDVGAGAGFPGVVLKIARPQIALTLMEPSKKRCAFLAELVRELGVEAEILPERGEEAARKPYREHYDLAVARAVAALPQLSEYCLPLVKPGGVFIAMKGDAQEELQAALRAIQKLGGAPPSLEEYALPDGARRSLVVVQKRSPTPPAYPRNGGAIAKRPLG